MPVPLRIAIVGAGHVGATCAYALLLSGLAPEIVLIDVDRARAEGEAMDLAHAVPFGDPVRVWAGTYGDLEEAAVVVLTAGANQRPGETRLQLLARNADIVRGIVPRVLERTREAILLVTTNPVDVLTWASVQSSGLSPARVIGSGTILDTARFRYLLSRHFDIDARSVHAHIIGEHGDTEVPVWSLATIGGIPLTDYEAVTGQPLADAERASIVEQTRRAAYHIIERKGATYYAVAAGVVRIVQAIVRDESTVLTVSSLITGYDGIDGICLSLPSIVNREGIARVLHLPLAEGERDGLLRSVEVLAAAQASIA
jgi:L-lactate dehydrogenase